MLVTRNARAVMKNSLVTVITLAVLSIAPYLTFVLNVFAPAERDYSYGFSFPWQQFLTVVMWVANAGIIIFLLYQLLFVVLPEWVDRGRMDLPKVAETMTLKALRDENTRLTNENRVLGATNKQLTTKVAEFQDPPKPEGYVQPAFEPPSLEVSRIAVINSLVFGENQSYKG